MSEHERDNQGYERENPLTLVVDTWWTWWTRPKLPLRLGYPAYCRFG